MAHFPAATPGFAQLRRLSLQGTFELRFMFRTGQRRGVLVYALDTSGFYYVSLALRDGQLDLRVFPDYEIVTAVDNTYNDNEWHTVTVTVTNTEIQMHVDDHEYFR